MASGGLKMASGGQVSGSILPPFWANKKMTRKSWSLEKNPQFSIYHHKIAITYWQYTYSHRKEKMAKIG